MLDEMVCTGTVFHARATPRHRFRYALCMLCVDVERVQSGIRWLLAGDGHLLPPHVLRDHFRRVGADADGRLLALTAPRSLSGNFNPVNFYFCVGAGGRLTGVALHVTNTPWGERHCYALDAAAAKVGPGRYRFEFDKAFHVSPFLPVAGRYTMRLAIREGALGIAIALAPDKDVLEEGHSAFPSADRRLSCRAGALTHAREGRMPSLQRPAHVSARLVLRTRPLTPVRALAGSLRRPVQSATTLARIYWQAARLWLLGAKFHVHPQRGTR